VLCRAIIIAHKQIVTRALLVYMTELVDQRAGYPAKNNPSHMDPS
jgi:hypothetical protein